MNTVFPSKTRRLAVKAVAGIFVLVALACVTTMFINAVRATGNATVNSDKNLGATETRTDDNVVEPTFSYLPNTPTHSCTDTWVPGPFDPPTHTAYYTLTLGNAPTFCSQVTWNFSNLTEGKNCTFTISSPKQTFSLNFLDSDGNQKDHITVDRFMLTREKDIKQVQLDLSNQSNKILTLKGMVYVCE